MMPTGSVSRAVEFTLRLIGVWPDSSCMALHRIAWTTVLGLSQTFQYSYLLKHIDSGDLLDLMDCLSLTLSNSLLLIKLIILWMNRRIVYDILLAMSDDWKECISNVWSTQAMASKAVLSQRFSNCIIGVYSTSIILYSTSTLLDSDGDDGDQDSASQERRLFLKMELPFESTVSPVYEVVMVAQFVQQYAAAITAGMMNALIITLILHVGGQIDIMCQELMEISPDEGSRISQLPALRSLIRRHQRIIALSENIEEVFSSMALVQFLSNTLVICFLGFVIVTSLDSPERSNILMKLIPYYTVVNFEAFILCFTGEYLSTKSKTIATATYESVWYNLKPNESKILMLVMLRSQRRLTITIGKFMDLTLESFTTILKASTSYVSVLLAVY